MMPDQSTVHIYGLLSGESFSFKDWLIEMKTVTFFSAKIWMVSLSMEEFQKWLGTVMTDLSEEGKIFGTKIQKTFPLS